MKALDKVKMEVKNDVEKKWEAFKKDLNALYKKHKHNVFGKIFFQQQLDITKTVDQSSPTGLGKIELYQSLLTKYMTEKLKTEENAFELVADTVAKHFDTTE